MAPKSTFLQLPPELGGLRFGPFPGSVQIGSDSKRCQLVLDPSHGVYPVHASVVPNADGSFTVAPATRDCKLFVQPYGQPHLWPINAPVQARVGDLVVLGTPQGPRFQLQQDVPGAPPPTAQQIFQTATNAGGEAGLVAGMNQFVEGLFKPGAQGIAGEVSRRTQATALATPGPLRTLYAAWSRFRTGVINNPVYLVGFGFALVGLIGTGTVSCTGVFYVVMDVLGLNR